MIKAYIDTDILIWHLKGNQNASNLLEDLCKSNEYELWIGAMQRAEILFYMRPSEESLTTLLLSQFNTAIVDQNVIDLASQIYRSWNPSHGTDVNDAILAATAILNNGHIFCQNTKHYPMPEVIVHKGWN